MTAQTIPIPQSTTRWLAWLTSDALVAVGLFAIALLLWLPFGFAMPFWADSWTMQNVADQGLLLLLGQVRPLVIIPFAVSAWLSPTNLFVGENVLLLLMLVGKSWLLYLILKRLVHHRSFAFAAASLLLTFPVDNSVFNLGTININFALFFYLLAVYALVAYWQDRRWYFLPLMWLALAVTTGLYETVYPLLICTPLLLVWQEKRITRRVVGVSLLWYAVPLVAVGWLLFTASQSQNSFAYQSSIFQGIALQDIASTFWHVYRYHFLDGWHVYSGNPYPGCVFLVAVIVAAICWWVFRQSSRLSGKTLLLLAVGGLAVIGLGYAPYFPTALRDAVDRTFFYSSVGAAVTLAAILLALAQLLPLKRLIYAGMVAGLAALGTIQLVDQHQYYYGAGQAELPTLRAIVAQAPLIQPDTLVLVIDDSSNHAAGGIFVSISYYLEQALRSITQNPGINAAFCYPNDDDGWGQLHERCRFMADRVVITWNDEPRYEEIYSRVVAFHYHPDGSLTLESSLSPYVSDAAGYAPFKLIDQSAPLPPRAISMLGMQTEN